VLKGSFYNPIQPWTPAQVLC